MDACFVCDFGGATVSLTAWTVYVRVLFKTFFRSCLWQVAKV